MLCSSLCSFGACNMFIFLFISRNFHAAHFHQGVTSFLVFGVQPGVIKSIQEGVLANCQFLDGMKILHTNHFFSFLFFFFRNSAIQAIWPIYTFLTLMSSDEQTHFQMLHVFMVAIFTLKIVSNPTFCLPSLTFCSKWIYALWIFM